MDKQVQAAEKLPAGKFFAWKTRDISQAGMQVILISYLMLYCTNALHMNPVLVGTLIMATKLVAGISDIFAGFVIDNTNSRWGKARPYEFCILGSWLSTFLLFSCPGEWGTLAKSIWIVVMYSFIQCIFDPLLLANQTPYMVRAFKSKSLVAKVCSYGGVFTTLGAMAVSLTFPMLLGMYGGANPKWSLLVAIYAAPLALLGLLRFFLVKEDTGIDAGKVGEKIKPREVLLMFKKNKYIWAFAGITGLFQLIQGLNVSAYYFTYIVGDISKQGIVSILSFVMLPVMFVFPRLLRRFTVSNLIQLGSAFAILGYLINFFAGGNIAMLLAGSALTSLAILPIAYLGQIIVMNLITYNQWHGLPRMDATTSIVNNFTSKMFGGIGSGVVGVLLSLAGYVSAGGAQQPHSAIVMIRSLYSLIPLACMVFIVVFATILGRLEKKIPQYEREIAARNSKEAARPAS